MNVTSRKLSLFLLGLGMSWVMALSAQGAVKAKPSPEKKTVGADAPVAQATAPAGTPTREIQEIEVKLDSYKTGKNISPAVRDNNARIKREILNGTFDLNELSRLALDKHWVGIAAGERSNFVNLMTNLLETKAIFSKEQTKTQGKAYTVRYLGDKFSQGKTQSRTLTQVYVPSEDVTVEIEYRLKKASNGWKVYDVIVDEASLVENYRYQFNSIITKHGYSELVRRMREKLDELKADRAQQT